MTSPPRRHRVRSLKRILAILGVLAALTLAAPAVLAAPPPMSELVKPELFALEDALEPGSTLWVDVHFTIASGWHIYWTNPGDSGLPTTIDWTLPENFHAGAIFWPVPQRFVEGGIANYGYTGNADLHQGIASPRDAA